MARGNQACTLFAEQPGISFAGMVVHEEPGK
jgi:hypothetical protein